jgi:hypothetical protein
MTGCALCRRRANAVARLMRTLLPNLGGLFLLFCVLLASKALEGQSEWKRITPVARGYQMPIAQETGPSTPGHATRLIFEYDGDQVRLVQQMPIEVASSTLQTASGGELGVFVDVRDAANRTLSRVPAPHAFSTSLEVFPEHHDQPIIRTDAPQAKGAFTVVVPTPVESTHTTLVKVGPARTAIAPDARAAVPEVVDLVSFPLTPNR